MTDAERLAAARRVERMADGRGDAGLREPPGAAVAEMLRARRLAADAADAPALQAMRRETLSRAARSLARARRWPSVGLAAAAIAAVGLPLALRSTPSPPAAASTIYATGVGQRLTVALADGSRVTLDTGSRVRVAYSASERRLVLEAGQAMFEVAKRQPRPFVVAARDREVVAHGTAFDVRLDAALLRVALVEGRVSVGSPGRGAVAMQPADVLTATASNVVVRHDEAAVAAITSWRDGRIEAEDLPLATVAAEMSRYLPRPVVVEPEVAVLRISGSFRAGDAAAFVDALQLGFPVDARRRADGATVLKRRA